MGRNRNELRERKKMKYSNTSEGEEYPPPKANNSSSSSSTNNLSINENKNENNYRNWSDLSEPLLVSILNLLPSFPDLASAASVSHPWNAAAASAASTKWWTLQPLLLKPLLIKPSTRFLRWAPPSTRYRLQSLSNSYISKPSYKSSLFSQTLAWSSCIGRSNSNLIFDDGAKVVLADVFTGKLIRSPQFDSQLRVTFGTLTAPPTTPSCLLLLVAGKRLSNDHYIIMSWAPACATVDWVKLDLESSPEIVSLVLYKERIYGFDLLKRIGVLEVAPCMSWKLLEVQILCSLPIYHNYGDFGQRFVECDGELLMVFFPPYVVTVLTLFMAMDVYKLDFEKCVWEKKKNLGNWSLFIDAVGRCGCSCKDPSRWGGRSNRVYVARPGYDGYSVHPVNGLGIDVSDDEIPLSSYTILPRWPSPVWVYQSVRSMKTIRTRKAHLKF